MASFAPIYRSWSYKCCLGEAGQAASLLNRCFYPDITECKPCWATPSKIVGSAIRRAIPTFHIIPTYAFRFLPEAVVGDGEAFDVVSVVTSVDCVISSSRVVDSVSSFGVPVFCAVVSSVSFVVISSFAVLKVEPTDVVVTDVSDGSSFVVSSTLGVVLSIGVVSVLSSLALMLDAVDSLIVTVDAVVIVVVADGAAVVGAVDSGINAIFVKVV